MRYRLEGYDSQQNQEDEYWMTVRMLGPSFSLPGITEQTHDLQQNTAISTSGARLVFLVDNNRDVLHESQNMKA